MKWMTLVPLMLAEPSIWRTYHSPRVSPSIESVANVSTPYGKWPHRMMLLVHRLRTTLATTLAAKVEQEVRAGQQRVQQVVLADLVAQLAQQLGHLRLVLLRVALTLRIRADEVVGRDAVLEEHRVDEAVKRLAEAGQGPRLVLVDPEKPVAKVVVVTDDVGVRVVGLVVALLPLRRRARRCPTPTSSSEYSGHASSPTGRAWCCARSPCCRRSSRPTDPPSPAPRRARSRRTAAPRGCPAPGSG